MESYDVIVIGAGQAGPSIAVRFAAAGNKVALIERGHVGGTCVNTGCMPTKTLVASARVAHVARRAADYGVHIAAEPRIDMPAVRDRARRVTTDARAGLESWVGQTENLELIRGHASFVGSHELQVGERRLSAPRIFINVGARPHVPDMPGIGDIDYLTSSSILACDRVPRHLVVIGGSYIGLEYAQIYRRLGATVTIVEQGPALISREDEDVSQAIKAILEDEGINCRLNAQCISFRRVAEGVQVDLGSEAGATDIVGSDVLLAVGRRPNTGDLGLDAAGIKIDDRGYIVVDDELATSVGGVWAVGDCNGRGAFTHTAYNDFEIVTANLLDGETRKVSNRILGYALYIDPPLGRVGLTERQARATGRSLLVSTRSMKRVGRAVERGETAGFMKVIADAGTQQVLGAAILGVEGDEAIHGILDIMNAAVPYPVLEWAVPIHPTVSELIPTLLRGLQPA